MLKKRWCYLAGDGVGFSDFVTPVASPDRDDWQLGQDDGSTDGCSNLLRALDAKTDVAIVVPNGYKGLSREEEGDRNERYDWGFVCTSFSSYSGTSL